VFIWDFFTGRKTASSPMRRRTECSSAQKWKKSPTRTYGKLARNDKGELVFNYRPWLILPPRTLVLPSAITKPAADFFTPRSLRVEGGAAKTVLLLPPRYRGHEEALAKIYNFAGTRDVGLRAAWAWFKSLFSGKTAAA
jgi:hypothetical protein